MGKRIKNAEVARRLGVTVRTLRRWDDSKLVGLPEPIIIMGRIYRDEERLNAWMNENPDFGKTTRKAG